MSRCRLPSIVRSMVENATNTIAFRRGGNLVTRTFAECFEDAERAARTLRARGIGPGDVVGIHGQTSYEWLLADLACVMTGAVSLALYPSAPADRVAAAAVACRVRLLLSDVPDQLDGAGGATVLPLDESSLFGDQAALGDVGKRTGAFTIVSTSGTLSEPKPFGVHSTPLLYTMSEFSELYGLGAGDSLLLYLPLSHLPQRMLVYGSLQLGIDLILASPRDFVSAARELSPTLQVSVPRVLEHLAGRIDPGSSAATPALFGDRVRYVFVGSAPTPVDLLHRLRGAGVPVYEVYGTTELGMIGLNTPDAWRAGTVGKPIPWGEVKLDADTSEILVRTPTPFLYSRVVDGALRPVAHDPDAFCSTGDVGTLDDDGFLTVRGRTRDFLALRSGEKVFVRPIEERIASAAAADTCLVIGNGQRHLSALLFYPPQADDLGDAPALEQRLRRTIASVNATLHPWERVRSFSVIPRLPTIDEGALTATMKIRRHKVEELFGSSTERISVD